MVLTKGGYSHDESMQQKNWRTHICATTLCDAETCTVLAEAIRRMAQEKPPAVESLPAYFFLTSLEDIYRKISNVKQ